LSAITSILDAIIPAAIFSTFTLEKSLAAIYIGNPMSEEDFLRITTDNANVFALFPMSSAVSNCRRSPAPWERHPSLSSLAGRLSRGRCLYEDA